MLRPDPRACYDELGPFDESFRPAFFEDADYWTRAHAAGIELTPVPAAVVRHTRRTSARHQPDMELLFQAHRMKYSWKHGIEPTAPPPYWHRTDRRVPVKLFGIGLNKTGTVSLHRALERLGYDSLHWGGEAAYLDVLRAIDEGVPVLHYLPAADAYSDIETLSLNFDLADAAVPGQQVHPHRPRRRLLARQPPPPRREERRAQGARASTPAATSTSTSTAGAGSGSSTTAASPTTSATGRSDLLVMNITRRRRLGAARPVPRPPDPARAVPPSRTATVDVAAADGVASVQALRI